MAAHPNALSADDVLDLPLTDDLIGYELVDGKPVPVTPASPTHGGMVVEVAYRLMGHVEKAGLDGRVYVDAGFVLGLEADPERMRAPDVSYVSRRKVEAHADPERLFRCLPDLAVEIELTSGKKPGGQQRIVDYLEAGVPLVWAIDPRAATATVYRPDGSARLLRTGDSLDGEEIVPGFGLPLARLFGQQ